VQAEDVVRRTWASALSIRSMSSLFARGAGAGEQLGERLAGELGGGEAVPGGGDAIGGGVEHAAPRLTHDEVPRVKERVAVVVEGVARAATGNREGEPRAGAGGRSCAGGYLGSTPAERPLCDPTPRCRGTADRVRATRGTN
jgi:hypothetical protein